ncbi:ABC transporter ATP-binding protein/permease [Clostridium swellfunianum]|uniref:ABC transporter ATP-binding protein n=1 Tax=Clostridium swellfunianum TaxID=1367462 RepID=UPI00202E249D|nr:ABC transporter ATP-binding protein [Clostridium swellfunianum]MCM0649548.1 ABC transporter ATP-binding protein/permease [Clostridium swellfunianum]
MARNKFDIDEELKSTFNFKYFKRLMKYIMLYKKEVFLAILSMLIASTAGLVGPYLVKIALDYMIPGGNISGLIGLSAIYLGTLIIIAFALKYKIRTMSEVGQNIIFNMRKDIFTHLQKLPFHYYDNRPHGKILVRVVNYINSLSDLLSNGIINMISELFSLFVILIFMFAINVRLTLISIVSLPALGIAIFLIKNAQRKAWQRVSSKTSNMNAYVHESICGMKITQSFAREEESLNIFKDLSSEYRRAWMRAVGIQFLLWPATENISVLTVSAIYVIGIAQVGAGVTVGVLIAFISYVWRFWQPITNLGSFYNAIVTAMAYLERIFETMDEKVTVEDLPNAKELPDIKGKVEFKNVSFAYEPSKLILNAMNFSIEPGECIAIVGTTGCGKSTIVNLISRFYDIQEGEILIDGFDIKDVTLESLRKQMGIMLQDSFIFSGTIMDNIRYGRLEATDEEVIEAAKAVKAHDFIMEMEKGYYTEVNERGTRLSVGQRQLVCFARTLLAKPKIIILDEATSSIDTKTEIVLQKGLEQLLKGRTSFMIAHRLSTIKNASRIMFIDKGEIIEEGSHQELMRKRGEYYKLYISQFELMEAI